MRVDKSEKEERKKKKCLKKNRLWCFNVIHLRQWQEITPHGARTQTHTCRRTHTHIWLWGVWNQISPNLYSGVTEVKMQTQMITARTYTRAHYMHARLHRCKHVHLTYTHMQMHTQRGNPGRFISGGLQHSGCLSHFIGHRGRTGMGLFKSNPARPPHTYTHTETCTHARRRRHTRRCVRAFSLAA